MINVKCAKNKTNGPKEAFFIEDTVTCMCTLPLWIPHEISSFQNNAICADSV